MKPKMSSQHFVIKELGLTCSLGIGKCGLEGADIITPGTTNICGGVHHFEEVQKNKLYNLIFKTCRSYLFMGEEDVKAAK